MIIRSFKKPQVAINRKTKTWTILALCPTLWVQCEGATEVRKGKKTAFFFTSWKELHSSGVLHHQQRQQKQKNNDLSYAMLQHVLTCTKNTATGFTRQLTKRNMFVQNFKRSYEQNFGKDKKYTRCNRNRCRKGPTVIFRQTILFSKRPF